ncbi:MAG: hypothetical protein RTU30_10220 [Candidatus Thorarchaeota archaeon]
MPLNHPRLDDRSFSNLTKGAAIIILLSFSLSAAIPYGVYATNLWDSGMYSIVPKPVTNSTFSNITDSDPESLILPNPYSVISQRPLIITEDYSRHVPEIVVTYEEALQAARNWLASVGPSFIIWNLMVASNSTSPPSWNFRFTFPGFSSYVIVETVTGRVIEFEIIYHNDFDPTPLTLGEAEVLAYEFLVEHNISIPDTARYIEGLPYDCRRFYSIVFQEYMGPVKIEASNIVVRSSAFTRGVSYYKYNWFGLDDVDLSSIISPNIAQKNADTRLTEEIELIPEIANETDVVWEDSELTLVGLVDPAISNDTIHRLAWVTNLHFNISIRMFEIRLYSDPYSSNLFGFRSPSSSYTTVLEKSTLYSSELLLGLSTLSVVSLSVSIILLGVVLFRRTNRILGE